MKATETDAHFMKRRIETRLDRLAMNRHGLITRADAIGSGMSLAQLRVHLRNGEFIRLRPGVYRVRGAPSTWEQTVLAACLSTGGIASHETACRLFGSGVVTAEKVTLSVHRGHRRDDARGVELRRTAGFAEGETAERLRIPVTSALRTLADMATLLDGARLLELTTDFLGRRVVTADQLLAQLARDTSVRRHGVRKLRESVRALLEDGAYDSAAETRLHHLLIQAGLSKPVRQFTVRTADGKVIARLDFAWPDRMLDLEMDGYWWHSSPEAFRQNRVRDMRLTALGWRIIRTTPAELDAGSQELLTTVGRILAGQSRSVSVLRPSGSKVEPAASGLHGRVVSPAQGRLGR
jgi:very-short-patch-repair endonuclease